MEDVDAVVTLLTGGSNDKFSARLVRWRGDVAQILVPIEIACGAAVKIETEDSLLLGEVFRSEPEGQRHYVLVKVSHVLDSLTALNRLNRAILGLGGARDKEEVEVPVRVRVRAPRS